MDDILFGTPRSKFFDVVKHASSEIVSEELDKILEKYAAMELLLSKNKSETYDVNEDINSFILQNLDEVAKVKDDLYIEFTGEIICRLDS